MLVQHVEHVQANVQYQQFLKATSMSLIRMHALSVVLAHQFAQLVQLLKSDWTHNSENDRGCNKVGYSNSELQLFFLGRLGRLGID